MERYAITYARVSAADQVEGTSLDTQKADCRLAADRLGVRVLAEFVEEGVSGTTTDRPQLLAALAFCGRHRGQVAYLIVRDLDRFARSALVHHSVKAQLTQLGVQLYSVNQPGINDTSPEARFLENIFAGVAQLERDKIHQRTCRGMTEARAKGAWQHAPPFGYLAARHPSGAATLTPDPDRAGAVRRAFEWFAAGTDQPTIAARLRAEGPTTRKGNPLSVQAVSHLLHHAVYAGKLWDPKDRSRRIDGLHPPLVSEDLWQRVQDRLHRRSPLPRASPANPHFPLATGLRCPGCGSSMAGSFSRGRSGRRYGYYHCRRRGCRAGSFPHAVLEADFEAALGRLELTERGADLFETDVIAVYREQWRASAAEREQLDKRRAELEARRDAVEDRYITGKIDDDTYRRHLDAVRTELLAVGTRQDEQGMTEEGLLEVLRFARGFLTSLSNTWKNGTVERRRQLQALLFPDGIRPDPDGRLRTLDVPPLLRVAAGSAPGESGVVDHPRTSWNHLLARLRRLAELSAAFPT